jgi:hypothetical protein
MKTTSKSIVRAVSATASSNRGSFSSAAGMFLGPKVLGELRILMRLASPAAPRQGLAAAR